MTPKSAATVCQRVCIRADLFIVISSVLLALWPALVQAAPPAKDGSESKTPSPEQLLKMLKSGHPRLLIDRSGFEALGRRVKTDATLAGWDKRLRDDVKRILAAPLPRYEIPDGLRLLSTSRRVLSDTYTLALMFRLHGDRRCQDRLWQEMETVAAFKDFNPKHFLDTAEMTHAFAIAYDWLYDAWSEPQRTVIREAIVRHGLKPGLKVYESRRGWPRSEHNWKQVCNGGMTLGALAIGDEERDLSGRILQSALASIPLAMRSYAPDGGWGEGPGYWGYATTYNVVMLAALESALGSDFGLSKMEGFSQRGRFPLYMTGPTGRAFNFADSGDRVGRADCLFWLARRFELPACSYFAASEGRPSASAMLWYDKPGEDPQAAGLALDEHWRGVEVVPMRSRWNDPQAMFVGIQAGSNRVNHNQLDLGSFVLDALGQRWVVDLGADNYNLPGYFGRQRYEYYRLRAEGHNTLVLNPGEKPDQDPGATAKIIRFESKPDRAMTIANLTPAYAKQAEEVRRGILLLRQGAVLVQDEVRAAGAVDFWWFVHTSAAVTLADDGRTATLRVGGATLTARLLGPEGARLEARPAEPLPSSPQPPKQARNEKIRKLTVHLPAAREVRLAVVFSTREAQSAAEVIGLKPLADW